MNIQHYPWCVLMNIQRYPWRVLMDIHVSVMCNNEYSCYKCCVYSWIFMSPLNGYSWIFMYPTMCTHEYSCHPGHVIMNIHVTSVVYLWIFMSPVTCVLMNIDVPRVVCSWIFISRVVCSWIFISRESRAHDYSCPHDRYSWKFMSPWCVLMNIQFVSPVMCAHENSCPPWCVLNIRVPCDVHHEYSCQPWRASWIFVSPVTCTHIMSTVTCTIQTPVTCTHEYSVTRDVYSWIFVTRDVYPWIFSHPWRALMNIMSTVTCTIQTPVTCTHEYSVTRDVYSWIFVSPVTCTHEYSVTRDVHSWISCHSW